MNQNVTEITKPDLKNSIGFCRNSIENGESSHDRPKKNEENSY
jgi:hypothetical protein